MTVLGSPVLEISDADRARLNQLATDASIPVGQRARIILALASPQASLAGIAREHGVSVPTVRRWLRRFREAGPDGLADAPRPGAPRLLDSGIRAQIVALRATGLGTRQIAERTGISQSSVSRIIRDSAPDKPRPAASAPTPTDALCVELFESMADEHPWGRFLEQLRIATSSDYCTMLLFLEGKDKPSLILAEGSLRDGQDDYLRRYYSEELLLGIPDGTVRSLSDVISQEELHDTTFYAEYLAPYGVGYVLGADIGTIRGVSANLRLSRSESGEDFGPAERATLEKMIPFLRAALNLFVKRIDTEVEREVLSATVSGMSVGSIMVDPQGRIMEANSPAQAILEQHDGLFVSGNRIAVHDAKTNKLLHELIAQNAEASINAEAEGRVRAILVDRPSGRESVSMLVRPATRQQHPLSIRPMALIHLVDPAQPRGQVIEALMQLFGLTRTEARIAASIANGQSIEDVARTSATTRNTVRSQMQSIFSKMGIRRQSELIRAVLISVGLLSI